MTLKALPTVDVTSLPEYPISAAERLDSHWFVQWNLRRWRGSEFRRLAYEDPEVGFYGRELFDLAQDESPIGTLPCDDEALAFLLRMAPSQWRELAGRDVSPLHGWHRVMCDNGQIRLAHPVVTEVAKEALDGKRRNATKNADDRMRKRLGTIAGHLRAIPGTGQMAEQEERLNAISDWIDSAYPGGSATLKRTREALDKLFGPR
ncbi:MAG: hypothetical protein CSA72_10515 [Rhodobacterales bacterium]|nr:MAG: hypothetical protein CSA72_10515 [Rhodobacterales bacterium]